MLSKPSQENLIQPIPIEGKDHSESESDESSDSYNIWGHKEKVSSSEEENNKDSFHTDKSMKNPHGSEKEEEKTAKKS